MASGIHDISGKKFGRLTAVSFSHIRNKHYYWKCVCDCGNESVVDGGKLRGGYTQSCGCLGIERRVAAKTIHGEHGSPEHFTWKSIVQRCETQTRNDYQRYGGRGITVCSRWRHGEDGKSGCECFIEDMGRRPGGEFSIDRIDNEGPYHPDNCRWATPKEQARNRRSTLKVLFHGEHRSLAELCEEVDIPYHRAYQRIKRLGWSVDEALA